MGFFPPWPFTAVGGAKQLGDYLIVAVQDSDSVMKYKSVDSVWYSTEERVEMINSLRIVDEVVVYHDVDVLVRDTDFDILALGEDQLHNGFQRAVEYTLDHGKEVVRLKRTEGISSSSLKVLFSTR